MKLLLGFILGLGVTAWAIDNQFKTAFEAGQKNCQCDYWLNVQKVKDKGEVIAGMCEGYQDFETWFNTFGGGE